MNEIFISYSRRDIEFVRRFLKGLNDNSYGSDKIWVDWEDIPPSSQWEDEIRKGIETANSIIFILSPEWAKSNECAKELKVAAEYNKRLFPIVWQNVDPNTIQKELASLNWIFFREMDNFDEAMKKLLAAMQTDLGWVAQHTNLTSRAIEWDTKKRDAAYLLRGGELREAEKWLSEASDEKQPRPTPLQKEYILASQQDEVKRQRRNMILISSALGVSVVLTILAAISWISALRQSQRALASQLSGEAISLVNSQPDLALLLSMEANHIGDELGESDPAWLGSLVTTLNSSPKLYIYLRAHNSDVRALAYSPDGKWLISAGGVPTGETGEAFLWDLKNTDTPQKLNAGNTNRFLAAAFSSDNRTAVTAGDGKQLFVWDTQACCDPVRVIDVSDKVRALKFVNLDGKEYLAVGAGGKITFWDMATGQQNDLVFQLESVRSDTRVLSLAFSPNGHDLAAGADDGYVTVWNLTTDIKNFQVCSYGDIPIIGKTPCDVVDENDKEIRGLAFNKDGSLLVSGSSDTHAWLWDTYTGKFLAKTPDKSEGGHISTVTSVSFNPVSGEIATVSWDNTVRLWNLEQTGDKWVFHRLDTLAGHANSIWATVYSPDGEWLVSASSDRTIILWRVNQINQMGRPVEQLSGEVWGLAVASDGKQFAAGDEAGNIKIWSFDGEHLTDVESMRHHGGVLALTYSQDNQLLVSAGYDGAIIAWNVKTGQETWRIDHAHTDQIWALMFTPDDKMLASASLDGTAKLWDTTNLMSNDEKKLISTMKHDDGVFTLTFNEDASKLLVAGYDYKIHQWDVRNPSAPVELAPLVGHIYAVNLLSYNPKYPPLMVSTSDDKTLLLWNVEKNDHTPPVLGLNESMEAVNFRPSGDWLASATDNNTVLLWQLNNPQKCAVQWNPNDCKPSRFGTPLMGHRAPVENVLFLTDVDMISSSQDGQLILWDLDKSHWYQAACDIVGRTLDDSEYNQYIKAGAKTTYLKILAWLHGNNDPTPSCIHN